MMGVRREAFSLPLRTIRCANADLKEGKAPVGAREGRMPSLRGSPASDRLTRFRGRGSMKITDVVLVRLKLPKDPGRSRLFLRVDTDEGVSGISEAGRSRRMMQVFLGRDGEAAHCRDGPVPAAGDSGNPGTWGWPAGDAVAVAGGGGHRRGAVGYHRQGCRTAALCHSRRRVPDRNPALLESWQRLAQVARGDACRGAGRL